ncbi:MAG: ABC transporter permease subunit [Planctomycetales bacterium]|nr:ABC transporter permease subunit [Planctomycetales bacterium]
MISSSYLFAQYSIVPRWVTTWLTPMWLLGMGVLVGLLVLLLLWAVLFVVAKKTAREIPGYFSEGVMPGLFSIACLFALTGLFITITVKEPGKMLESLALLSSSGETEYAADLPESEADSEVQWQAVAVGVDPSNFQSFAINTTEPILFSYDDNPGETISPTEIDPADGLKYVRNRSGVVPFDGNKVPNFHFANLSPSPAEVTIVISRAPGYPEVMTLVIATIFTVIVFSKYVIQSIFFPKLSAVALSTAKSELAQPLFYILSVLGAFLLIAFIFIPYNTFGEDIKMLKDSGLTLIMIAAIVQGIWTASNSVADEIEGRTALTVLSKPISRAQFLIGKFSGIMWTVGLLFAVMGVVFLFVVAYKPIYDARELGSDLPEWEVTHFEVVRTIPGLLLAFFETAVLVAFSVAISTRLPLLANLTICFAIYVLGHLTPVLVKADIDFAPVTFIGNLIATVLPVLEHFNIQAAIATGALVPWDYLGMTCVYCVLYSTVALLLALILFEDRDLA